MSRHPSDWNVNVDDYDAVETLVVTPQHPIYCHLLTKGRIESLHVYNQRNVTIDSCKTKPACICLVQLGRHVDGHPGIVHGGILALLIDEVIGLGCEALAGLQSMAFTANLSIDYRAPCPVGSRLRIPVNLDSYNGRKLIWKCRVESPDQTTVYCEAKSLFLLHKGTDAKKAANSATRQHASRDPHNLGYHLKLSKL